MKVLNLKNPCRHWPSCVHYTTKDKELKASINHYQCLHNNIFAPLLSSLSYLKILSFKTLLPITNLNFQTSKDVSFGYVHRLATMYVDNLWTYAKLFDLELKYWCTFKTFYQIHGLRTMYVHNVWTFVFFLIWTKTIDGHCELYIKSMDLHSLYGQFMDFCDFCWFGMEILMDIEVFKLLRSCGHRRLIFNLDTFVQRSSISPPSCSQLAWFLKVSTDLC